MSRLVHTRRPAKAVAAAAIATAALVLGPVAAADAATSVNMYNNSSNGNGGNTVLVSTDGVNFAASATGPLFVGDYTIVPGDTQAAELYVRNSTSHDAVLTIYLTDIAVSQPEFAQSLTLQATTLAQGATPTVGLATASSCQILLENENLPKGETVRAALALAMADVSGTTTQNESANFNLRVTLRDAKQPAPAPASGCTDGTDVPAFEEPPATPSTTTGKPGQPLAHTGQSLAHTGKRLASTGFDLSYPLAFAGVILGAGSGLLLVAGRRRRKRQE